MAMIVAVGTFDLHFPEVHSLKEKRQVLRCVIDRVRAKFNASVAEVEDQNLWQRGTVGVALVSSDRTLPVQMGQKIEAILTGHDPIGSVEMDWEFL